MTAPELTQFSLFSGAGGIDCGFRMTGRFKTCLGNDILEATTRTFSANFGARPVLQTPSPQDLPAVFVGDVAKLDFEPLERMNVDVVTGGPPCQDFSVVRGPQTERQGIGVSRGRLYSHFVRALVHLKPKAFVFENVPGLVSANNGQAYETILKDFSNMQNWKEIQQIVGNSSDVSPQDYEILYKEVTNAARVGAPQARRRLLIIGVRKDLSLSVWWKVKTLRERIWRELQGKSRLAAKYPLTPLEAFEGRTLTHLQDTYSKIMKEYVGVADEVKTPRSEKWKSSVWDRLTFDVVDDYLFLNGVQNRDENEFERAMEEHAELLKELGYSGRNVRELKCADGTNEIPKEKGDAPERMKRIPPCENHEFVRGTEWEVEGKGMSLIYRRIHPLKPAYTVVAYGGGGTWGYHYERNRSKLTHRERARLQTFPDDFVFKGNSSEIRAQIGEAVPPLLMKRVAEALADFLQDVRLEQPKQT
jgi:DNA (cytosine-5)-methyltransferase 1